jgi:inositol phosphorylceramide mannosyltransferase catalytic subunit
MEINHAEYTFAELDAFLLGLKGKIIHQIWFGNFERSRRASRKTWESLEKHRNSWKEKNPDWFYICWNLEKSRDLVKNCYPQHLDMYNSYPYHVQRCDAVRYFMLHRYGGLYADMDYHCTKPWNDVLEKYKGDIYLVETPNNLGKSHVSNSLMYAKPGHVFWSKFFIYLEMYKTAPSYYGRHVTIMFTTGPGILNRAYNRYKIRYRLNSYPYEKFHPFGLTRESLSVKNKSEIYAYHCGKGSWESSDSKYLIFLYTQWRIVLFVFSGLIIPQLVFNILQ